MAMQTLIKMIAIALLATVLAVPVQAQQSGARQLVERGMSVYSKEGADAGIKAWLKGSSLETNTQALTQANMLRQIEDFYGKPESIEIIRENQITPRTYVALVAINYSKGALFGRMQAFQTKGGDWVLTEFRFHTDASMIFPSDVAYGK